MYLDVYNNIFEEFNSLYKEVDKNKKIIKVEKDILKETIKHEQEYIKRYYVEEEELSKLNKDSIELLDGYIQHRSEDYEKVKQRNIASYFNYYINIISFLKLFIMNMYDCIMKLLEKEED